MDVTQLFSDEMLREFDTLENYLSTRRRQSLPDLLRAWRRYGRLVAERERVSMDDYLAMLFARDAIQDILNQATPSVCRLLEVLVSESDDLFLFGTERDEANLLQSRATGTRSTWWWTRVPFVVEE
jgi:hypothetical protein